MMSDDYSAFVAALTTLAKVYGKTLDDEQVAFYWNALKDRPFADVEARMGKYARKGKFFPKPRDLRPIEVDEEKVESNPAAEARYQEALRENERNWNTRLHDDPTMAKLLLCEALLARYDVERDQDGEDMARKRFGLRARVAELLVDASPGRVLKNPTTWRLVLRLFNEAGIIRLEHRAKQQVAA